MRNRFRNMVDYAKSYYFSFAERPLNEIDALIFSWLSYLRLDKTFIRFTHNQGAPLNYILDSKRINKESLKTYDPEMTSKLLIELGKNPRFSNITISNIVEKWNEKDTEQFYAMTINYKDLFSFISYRGTDATMVGWKEDVMMGVSFPVRGQIAASSYLEKYFTSFNKVIYIGGHSKGGNLAIYSAITAKEEIFTNIKTIYSFDGPGFLNAFRNSRLYELRKSKIFKVSPTFSFIGSLLEPNINDFSIIESTGFAFWQHNPFKWYIKDNQFIKIKKANSLALSISKSFDDVLNECGKEVAEKAINDVFNLFSSNNIESSRKLGKEIIPIMDSIKKMDETSKELALSLIKIYLKIAAKNISNNVVESRSTRKKQKKALKYVKRGEQKNLA